MENEDEILLLQRLKDDDIKALEIIFHHHYANLYKYLLLIFRNQLLVDHIAQDIFIYLWENRKHLRIQTSLESYLYTAGRYQAINQLRNARRRERINLRLSQGEDDSGPSPFALLESKELEKIIEEAISTLPERCQQIFRLSREEELPYKEIADVLHISVNTVETQMGIAFRKLRQVLHPFYLRMFFLG
jgi:RNA polymerase sigma-70 factor (ECF subfamily)